ncbi:O-antigen ligase family protein [Jatrophihabitans lederbergiae]|uniref:O-antigen ligase family protein n=1 Tax=Jatrophihabitans lederbergiae TaxID=3075547 RepID=A0ABU2JA38_9ACTN|nr:O-antigen ligase family protein [Jatrophihabitans sp. DSM 44399]MDT0261856.1 O-antigen ligase family protein [Jatrophihabitans sp. DSM 44399]
MSRPLAVPPAPRQLPSWPLYVLFAGFPLWWVLGLGAFAVVFTAVPMLILLVQRRVVEVPPAFWLWIGFVVWACAAALELSSQSRLIGFSVRMSNYVGSGIVFLYVYNARERLSDRKVRQALVLFFAFVVFGGYLGVLFPHGNLSTPAQSLLPASIANNEYVGALVHPHFAEVQHPYGSPRVFYRPSAPFPYTNSWGCNVALLVPLVISAIVAARRRRSRLVMAVLLAAACVPAFATLNRGMFLALGFLLAYVAIRLALRGQLAPLVAVIGATVIGLAVAVSLGVWALIQERLHYSQTNVGRQAIYREAFDGAMQSPLFGHGAPQPSQTVSVSIGTQGQVWNLMFSYGFIALAFFLAWFAWAAIKSIQARGEGFLWVHATLVVSLLTFLYYGYDGIQLTVVMVAAGLAVRGAPERPAADGAVGAESGLATLPS